MKEIENHIVVLKQKIRDAYCKELTQIKLEDNNAIHIIQVKILSLNIK
ncbi:MAG TPA: hypothetical protein QKA08_04060 [Candidatus Megaira endosymbiont of Nemacystus decipiens]|nr:hypothetical protein [Candidatus Megaera endosymbiont of Nemacystus decipiens]